MTLVETTFVFQLANQMRHWTEILNKTFRLDNCCRESKLTAPTVSTKHVSQYLVPQIIKTEIVDFKCLRMQFNLQDEQ